MAIRVFFNQWTEQIDGDGIYIEDPIDDYLNNISLSAPVVSRNFYARQGLTKRPDRAYLIKVMRGNLTDAEWTMLGNIAGVRAVPNFSLNKTISSISTATRNKIFAVLDSLGIPRTTYTSAATVGGFLRNMLTELDGDDVDFGAWELTPDEWA